MFPNLFLFLSYLVTTEIKILHLFKLTIPNLAKKNVGQNLTLNLLRAEPPELERLRCRRQSSVTLAIDSRLLIAPLCGYRSEDDEEWAAFGGVPCGGASRTANSTIYPTKICACTDDGPFPWIADRVPIPAFILVPLAIRPVLLTTDATSITTDDE